MNIVERCDVPGHPHWLGLSFAHDCDTGNLFRVPPGWEWTGKPNGAIVRKVVKK